MLAKIAVSLLLFSLFWNPAMAQGAAPVNPPGLNDEILVRLDPAVINLKKEAGRAEADALARSKGLDVIRNLEAANTIVLRAPNAIAAAAELKDDPAVAYAEPNVPYFLDAVDPNDPYFKFQWALKNTGQVINGASGYADADIDAPEAWELSRGEGSLVAVIDTGIALSHPDLASSIWNGENCVTETGAPLGGCQGGYDFAENDTDPTPRNPHGTHVAGIIAAASGNSQGVAGVAPDARIMALRTDSTDEEGRSYITAEAIVRAIDFARENGAHVINASFGGPDASEAIRDAIVRFGDEGGLFVASAGNAHSDNDTTPSYPGSFDLPNIIAVAATTNLDDLAGFSNTGSVSVDVGAPGEAVMSTVLDPVVSICQPPFEQIMAGPYDCYSGTSMAAPQVAGIAALLVSYKPAITLTELNETILTSGDSLPALANVTATGKRVNAHKALLQLIGPTQSPAGGTVTVVPQVVNNDFRTATVADFRYSVDGGGAQAFSASGATVLSLPAGTHSIVGISTATYSANSNCTAVTVTEGSSSTCTITYDDLPDQTPPVITLIGANPQTITTGQKYTELGATAVDDLDGPLPSSSILINSSAVNTKIAGTYTVTYTAKDRSLNTTSIKRTIIVSKSGKPR